MHNLSFFQACQLKNLNSYNAQIADVQVKMAVGLVLLSSCIVWLLLESCVFPQETLMPAPHLQ